MKYKTLLMMLTIFFLAPALASAEINYTDSLNTYYNFNETSGTTLYDHIGSNDLNNVGTPTLGVTGIIGDAYNYSGTNTYSRMTSPTGLPTGSGDRTVNFWVQGTPTDGDFLFAMGTYTNNQMNSIWKHSNGDVQIGGFGAGNDWDTNINWPTDGDWHMFTLTVDSNNVSIWFDGVANASWSHTYNTVQGFLQFARHPADISGYGPIVPIDEAGIWSRALNETEIEGLYNDGQGCNILLFTAGCNLIDPNSTLTIQAQDALNSSVITGLCANITNSTHEFSKCDTNSTNVTFTGNQDNVSIGVYNITVYSVGVGDGSSSPTYTENTTENYNWTVDVTVQIPVIPLGLVLNFEDEETRTSLNGTNVSVSVISNNNTIYDYSTDTGAITIAGIFTEGEYTVRYTADNYSMRDYYFNLSFEEPTQIETLYLLRQSVYTPGVVSVKDFDGTNVVGAEVFMNRYYGNDTIPNLVQSGTTDSDGNTVFIAESVTAFYTFSVEIDGETKYDQTVPQLLTVDNTGLFYKTIVLDATGTDVTAPNTGFNYNFTPQTDLYLNTLYNFTGEVYSSNWALDSCTYSLYHTNGTLISENTSFCGNNSGVGHLSYTPLGITQFYAELVLTTSSFTNTYQQLYTVINGSRNNFTMVEIADDLSDFSGYGFSNFSKFVISFLFIVGITLAVASRSNFVNNPEEVLWLVFVLSIGFSYIDWMNINNPLMPIQALNQWFMSVVFGFMAILASIRKWGVNE